MFEQPTIEIPTAIFAGFLSFISPCVLPLIPGYLSFISGVSMKDLSSKEKSKEEFEKLKKRVEELASSEIINEGRLEMEVALIVEKADITEECIRFKSHNKLFLNLLKNGKSEGRKLNFLVQEMHREANTIGSKANDASIAHLVVGIKEEVEKLREQIQNIE